MRVFIAGDYVPQQRLANLVDNNDYSFFDEIKPLLTDVDLAIVNLEAPVATKGQKPIEKCGPNLKISPNGIKALHDIGVDMVTLANNHILDYGTEGLEETMLHLKNNDIDYVGVGDNLNEASVIKYIKIGGQILAIINCCEHEFAIATKETAGANPLNPIKQFNQIKEAKSNADKVLVIVHGGHEHWQLPSPRMVETYRFFIDAGADVVVNHHQHCYSGIESYNNGLIFYGLGNFCFDSDRRNSTWNEGYCLILDFDKNCTDYQIYPFSQCDDQPVVKLLDQHQFDKTIDSLNYIIADSDLLDTETLKYYRSNSTYIRSIFEPYSGRIASKLYSLGFLPSFLKGQKLQQIRNYLNCESHHDKVKAILQ